MRAPLQLVLFDGVNYHDVTEDTTGLSFTRSAYGGNLMASASIDRDPSSLPRLGAADTFAVFDKRSGAREWDGYLNNPGEHADPTSRRLDVSALGGAALAGERSERLIYRDTDLGSWMQDDSTGAQEEVQVEVPGRFPDTAGTRAGQAALFIQVPNGSEMTSGVAGRVRYRKFEGSPMTIGAMRAFRDGGVTSTQAAYNMGFMGPDWPTDANQQEPSFAFGGLTPTGATVEGYINDPHPAGWGAFCSMTPPLGTITKSWYWFGVSEVAVLGKPVNRYGTSLACPRTTYVLSSEVVDDVVGRLLYGLVDPVSAEITAGAFQIETLAFLDPTSANGVFDTLLRLEDRRWGIGNRKPNGKHQFWWLTWDDATPRYVFDEDFDSVDLPGSEDQLCNRIAVAWMDVRGVEQVTVVGADVSALGGNPVVNGVTDPAFAGRVKDAEKLTLPQGRGSLTAAQQAGAMRLADVNSRVYAGTVEWSRPLHDRWTGNEVMPWQVEPGCSVRLQQRGIDVRLTETTFTDDSESGSGKLNSPQRTAEELLARL